MCIPPSFSSLPLEIIIEILKELKCQDILRLQQTCRRLQDISLSRSLWLFLVTKYSTALPSRTRPEEPLECYSTRELQQWLFARVSADIGWKSTKRTIPIRQRTIMCELGRMAIFIPGGRWLLTRSTTVTAHDLDSQDIKSTLLIEQIDKQDSRRLFFMVVHIDSSAPVLTFDLVLTPYLEASQLNSTVQFWRVMLDGHGASATLKAKHLKTLTMPSQEIMATSLHDHMYAQLVSNFYPRVEVYNWQKSTSESYTSASLIAEGDSFDIHLLPDNMVACFSTTTLLIYEIPILQTHQSTLQSPVLQPLWRHENSSIRIHHRGSLSRPYVFHNLTRFTFVEHFGESVHGLVIPRDKSQAPYTFKFMDIPGMPLTFSCGHEKVFARRYHMAWSLCIQWPDGRQNQPAESPLGSIVTNETIKMGSMTRLPLMDEELGRVAVSLGRGMMTVIDFASYPGNVLCHSSTSSKS